MLYITRTHGEAVRIGEATVTVLISNDGRVKLGIDAPRHVNIARTEIDDRRQAPPPSLNGGF